ncbi:MAG: phage integrase N-terminal SAM-like domain-containing protein, partial [Anaerolineales bacterium]|nr:phage integrase N-terminal SAM-like domain-containing protein [Anaerolineales bacterium]
MSDNTPQNELFDESNSPTHKGAPAVTADASLQAALGGFEQHMRQEGFAVNTIKSFASDIRLLGKYLGAGQAIGEIATDDLNKFLNWLVYERGVPCSPKSYARRVTTL